MPDEMLDYGDLVACRYVFTPMPPLLDVRRGDRQHVAFPNSSREPHPRVRGVFGRVGAAIHPDRAALFVRVDVFMNRNKLVSHFIPFFPNAYLQRASMDVFHDMHLALMFRKRKTTWTVRQAPLAGVVIDWQPQEFDERWPRKTLRVIFVLDAWRPHSREIDLSECGNPGE